MSFEVLQSPPSPADMLGWLRSSGWKEVESNGRWTTLRKETSDDEAVVDVPLVSEARDYAQAAAHLIEDIAHIEQRKPSSVLADIRAASLDVIRLALRGSALDGGGLPLRASVGTLQGARDLLLAAACSAADPRPAYLGRKSESAMGFLDVARWSRVEEGSVVLCLEVPVAPLLQGSLFESDEPETDPGRKVTRQLVSGMSALQAALPACSATDSIEPALEQVEQGLSANLCAATAKLIEESKAQELGLAVGFAPRRPAPRALVRRVAFRSNDLPILREIARGLQSRTEERDTEVVGPVVGLQRGTEPGARGTVTLQVEWEGRARLVQIEVEAADYAAALEAHRRFQFLRARGILRSLSSGLKLELSGRFVLENIRDNR